MLRDNDLVQASLLAFKLNKLEKRKKQQIAKMSRSIFQWKVEKNCKKKLHHYLEIKKKSKEI